MRKHSGLPKLASPARVKKQQHKLNTLKIKSIKTSLPSFLSPTLPSASRSASDHTSWKLCSNFHSCKYCSIFNWCFSQKPSKAVSISCSWPSNLEHRRRTGLEQFANRGQAEMDKQRWTSPRDHLFRSSGPKLSGEVNGCGYMICEDLRENFHEITTADDSTCVKQLLVSPFIWIIPGSLAWENPASAARPHCISRGKKNKEQVKVVWQKSPSNLMGLEQNSGIFVFTCLLGDLNNASTCK